ncbi:MAG: hypothetical protein AAF726_06100 [Planctomycetota bacterium]
MLPRFLLPLLAAAPSPALAASDAGPILLREGEVLSNGWTVETFLALGIANDGRWAALVDTDEPPNSPSKAVVLDGGAVLLAEGQPLPGGQRIGALLDMSVDPAGTISTVLNLEVPAGAPTHSRLYLGTTLALETGDPVFGPNLPGPSTVMVLRDVESAFPYAFVEAILRTASGTTYRAFLRFDYSSGSQVIEVVAREGLAVPGGQGVVGSAFHEAAIASDGSYLTSLDQDAAGTNDVTIALRDGLGVFAEGVAGPLGGTTWRHAIPPAVAKAGGSSYVFSSTLRRTNGAIDGVVLVSGAIVAVEGNTLFGAPQFVVGNLGAAAVAQSSTGIGFYKVPTQVGSVLMAFPPSGVAELLLQSTVDTFEGVPVASVKPERRGSLAVTGNGREIVTEVELVGGISALVLVERDFAFSIPCNARPNSTGVPGEIAALGSTFLSVNSLDVVATSLPPDSFGYLGCSTDAAFVPNAGGSSGNLCLGGAVGRYVAQVASSGPGGTISTVVDLLSIPQPTGFVAASVGETWRFQLWHRDSTPGGGPPTSNFTKGLGVLVR